MVQVHCDEGVANHVEPESCAGIREDVGEALTGERTGQPLSQGDLGFDQPPLRAGPHWEGEEPWTMMNEPEKSDSVASSCEACEQSRACGFHDAKKVAVHGWTSMTAS